jgi:DNA polymerase-3 subunit beta
VDGRELVRALRRVSLLAADSWKCVRFDLFPDRLRLSTSSNDLGDASEELGVEYGGKPFSVGYNVRYMIELIGAIGEDQDFHLELYGGTFPGKFSGATDPGSFAILMPMRLNKEEEERGEQGEDESSEL